MGGDKVYTRNAQKVASFTRVAVEPTGHTRWYCSQPPWFQPLVGVQRLACHAPLHTGAGCQHLRFTVMCRCGSQTSRTRMSKYGSRCWVPDVNTHPVHFFVKLIWFMLFIWFMSEKSCETDNHRLHCNPFANMQLVNQTLGVDTLVLLLNGVPTLLPVTVLKIMEWSVFKSC